MPEVQTTVEQKILAIVRDFHGYAGTRGGELEELQEALTAINLHGTRWLIEDARTHSAPLIPTIIAVRAHDLLVKIFSVIEEVGSADAEGEN